MPIRTVQCCLCVALLAIPILGCRAEPALDEPRARTESGATNDSAWAVAIASSEYSTHNPGVPVVMQSYRREGTDYVIGFHPGPEWLGAGAVIRVKSNGTAAAEVITQ